MMTDTNSLCLSFQCPTSFCLFQLFLNLLVYERLSPIALTEVIYIYRRLVQIVRFLGAPKYGYWSPPEESGVWGGITTKNDAKWPVLKHFEWGWMQATSEATSRALQVYVYVPPNFTRIL